MSIKKFFLIAQIMILLIFTAGCWDYNDFNELALVSAIGFDMDENSDEITVTVHHYIPGASSVSKETKSGSMELPVAGGAVKAKGLTISDALAKVQEARRKELFYGYINVIVLNETAAKKIMKEIIGFSNRTPNVRTTAYLAITGGKAEDVLCTMDPTVSVPIGTSIRDLIEQSTKSGSGFPVSIEDFAEKTSISGMEPVVPRVTVISVKKPGNGSSSQIIENNKPYKFIQLQEGYHIIDGMAAFKNYEFTGWLEKKENTGLGWIASKDITTYVNVNIDSSNEFKKKLIFYVTRSKSKIEAKLEDGRPVFTVKTNIEADLYKFAEMDFDLLTPEAVSLMEIKLANSVRSEIEAAIKKGQKELKTDIFGFGFALYRKYPRLWHKEYEKKWQDIFPDMKINIDVQAKILNTGTGIKKITDK